MILDWNLKSVSYLISNCASTQIRAVTHIERKQRTGIALVNIGYQFFRITMKMV